jgi:hypothetical protein
MLLDLIAIIFIVILSCCLCMNDSTYNCQMSHIVLGLSVIVFYKLAKAFKFVDKLTGTKENFDTVTNSINDFISASDMGLITLDNANQLTPEQFTKYNNKVDSLINSMNNLKKQLENPYGTGVNNNPSSMQSLDLASQQQYQIFQIDYLNKQIKNAQDIINTKGLEDNNTIYKPIKVYSSCVVSNADGSTTVEQPVNNSCTSTNNGKSSSYTTNNLGQKIPSSSSTDQILKTIGQTSSWQKIGPASSSVSTPTPPLALSPTTGGLGDLLKFSSASLFI